MSSNFETLPNEILMIVMKYSGDVFTIFRTYYGLNQRFNSILFDKRLHLLADFLRIDVQQISFDNYYLPHSITEQELRAWFQSLIVFYIKERYNQLGQEFQFYENSIKTIRECLPNEQLLDADEKLKQIFDDLQRRSLQKNDLKQIELLILKQGARLQCNDHHFGHFNLAKALNKILFTHIDNNRPITRSYANRLLHLFKLLILSNPNLLKNRDDVSSGGCPVYYFLFLSIYPLECIYYRTSNYFSNVSVNMNCYRSIVELSLFILQCQKQMFSEDDQTDHFISDLLSTLMNAEKMIVDDELFLDISRLEILKILFRKHVLLYDIKQMLRNLIQKHRQDMILFICECCENVRAILSDFNENRQLLDMMTGDRVGRELFKTLIEKNICHNWLTDKHLFFFLLQKKERKLLEKLLTLSPSLINQLDEDGNDPLLYICLKVRGCRHRIIEFLIQKGCNLQRTNYQGQNFIHTIQLEKNRKLFKLNLVVHTFPKDSRQHFRNKDHILCCLDKQNC